MATIQITHFDQLGTICNDYSQEYRITGALPYILVPINGPQERGGNSTSPNTAGKARW